MQTFLPYSSYEKSAKVLDNKRLGKQRVEAYQILNALIQGPYQCIRDKTHRAGTAIATSFVELTLCLDCNASGKKTPWYNHPAVQMWEGYEWELCLYGQIICDEWINRGFKDTIRDKFLNWFDKLNHIQKPPWLGNKKFHSSHRANLLRKNPKHYGQFGWKEKPSNKYWWPTKEKAM